MRIGECGFGDLVELLGPESAEKILLARGGRSLYIPHEPGPHSPLVNILGQEDADKLAARYGGNTVEVPIVRAKRLRILHLRRVERWSISRIAAEMRCTERTVYNVLASSPENDQVSREGQLDMFAAL